MTALASGTRAPDANMVDGDYALTQASFRRIAAVLYEMAGLFLPDSKATLMYSRLGRRLRALGMRDFTEYCDLISDPDETEERGHLLAAMTTNVTRFYREPHHFDHLRTAVLPPLVAAARRSGRIRLWSAACSTGPEPYSMGATLLDLMPDAAEHDVKILATDIDPNVVAEAKEGRYSAEAMEPVSAGLRQRWFKREADGGFLVSDDLRRLVAFREMNLIGTWPMHGPFDAIFCRNVAIYFDEPTQAKIWQRFASLLTPGGTLCIGHSERVSGPAMAMFETAGITTYRRRGGKA